MLNRAQHKVVDRTLDQSQKIVEKAGERSMKLAQQAGDWVRKNDSKLLGIVALTLGVGVFSYLLTRGRRFILIL